MGRITEKYNWTKHQIETSQSNLDSIAGFADNIARVRKLQVQIFIVKSSQSRTIYSSLYQITVENAMLLPLQ